MAEPRDAEFEVEGRERLRGWLFTPRADKSAIPPSPWLTAMRV